MLTHPPLVTRTGGYPIGFRRGWSEWQADLASVLGWAGQNGLSVIDLGGDVAAVDAAVGAGLKVGSVDLLKWSDFLSPDAGVRRAATEANRELISRSAEKGVRAFFTVMLPADPKLPRRENFGYMVDGLGELAGLLETYGGRLAIEGWPGPGALACTPADYKALLTEIPSKAIGVNFDPSHLIRMGIDALRFLHEVADRVAHVHGKDTEIDRAALQELGWEQPATFAPSPDFGGPFWRYTIPGHGEFPWTRGLEVLQGAGYDGYVSIELEDFRFNGSEEGEKNGLLAASAFLASA